MGSVMHMSVITLFLASIALYHVCTGQEVTYVDLYLRLESQIKSLNSSLNKQQKQIDVIVTDMLIQSIGYEDDLKKLNSQIKTAEGKLAALEKSSKENTELLTSNTVQLVAAEILIADLDSRMDKLNATSELWRSNFRVVNRTFGELRKKQY